MRHKRADTQHIYSIYDRTDMPVFVGTPQECAEYLGCDSMSIYKMICCNNQSTNHQKYKIYYVCDEKVESKRCVICGKVKPWKDFTKRKNEYGEIVARNYCLLCKAEISKKAREKQNDENE